MSLSYFIQSQTTGDKDSVSQVLTQNTPARFNRVSRVGYFDFDYPLYSLEGATFNYYQQDYNSISYDITNGKIYSLIFSANTHSLSGNNSIDHSLYRVSTDLYESFLSDPENNGFLLEQALNEPLLSIREYWSALTLNLLVYTYSFPTQYKDVGNFTQDIFKDKFQYFLNNPIGFDQSNDLTVGDAYYNSANLDDQGSPIPVQLYLEPSATTRINSSISGPRVITGNTIASGFTFQGAFFTYFVPPKKPNLNVSGGRSQISVQGPQNTLSPIFNFNNTDDGDYYKLQVNYDVNDTPYSGTDIYVYTIEKQAGDAEFVRTYSTPLRANNSFIYRIGNTKEVVNLFGNKQSMTTWSDSVEAEISSTGQYNLSGTTWRNIMTDYSTGSYHMSGVTVGANTIGDQTFTFTMTSSGAIPINTASGVTIGPNTYDVLYNTSVTTLDWQNAVNTIPGISSAGLYVVGGSSSSAATPSDFAFTFSTESHRFPGVIVKITSIFLNTSVDLSIDLRSSENVVEPVLSNYVNTTAGQQYTRISDSNGNFDFGNIIGGYYLLETSPQPPPSVNSEYQPISTYITVNSIFDLNLVFSIYWNNQLTNGFDVLGNQTFL